MPTRGEAAGWFLCGGAHVLVWWGCARCARMGKCGQGCDSNAHCSCSAARFGYPPLSPWGLAAASGETAFISTALPFLLPLHTSFGSGAW